METIFLPFFIYFLTFLFTFMSVYIVVYWISVYIFEWSKDKKWGEYLFSFSYRMIDIKMGIEKFLGLHKTNDKIDILYLSYEDDIGTTTIYKKEYWNNLFYKMDWNNIFTKNMVKYMIEQFRKDHIQKEIKNLGEINVNRDDIKDMRLRVYGRYMGNEFILYVPYENGIKIKDSTEISHFCYPFYDKERMNLYREDIIYPYYTKNPKKNYDLYSCFQLDSKNIKKIKINGVEVDVETKNLFEKLRTPFFDFGILYHCPIKVKWILQEIKYDIGHFEKIEVEFMQLLFDEDKFELKPHIFYSENINDYFITDHMKKKIIKRNEEMGREILFENENK